MSRRAAYLDDGSGGPPDLKSIVPSAPSLIKGNQARNPSAQDDGDVDTNGLRATLSPVMGAKGKKTVRMRREEVHWTKGRGDWTSSEYDTEDQYTLVEVTETDSEYEEEKLQRTLKEYSGQSIHDIIRQDSLKIFDAKVRLLNQVIFLVALTGNCAMMAEVYLGWDPDEAVFVQNNLALTAKIICTGFTLLLMALIIYYYRVQLLAEKESWHVADGVDWRKHVYKFLCLELFVCSIHTFPEPGEIYDDRIGAVMFARAYLLIRCLRDSSLVYRKRLEVLSDKFLKQTGACDFNWHLAVKFIFQDHMWPFVCTGILVVWFTMAYIIWLCERPIRVPPQEPFTLQRSVWLVVVTMTTVGYGDESARSLRGMIASGITAVLGLTNTALLVYAVTTSLTPTGQENRVKIISNRFDLQPHLFESSAHYIALWWKHYKVKRAYVAADTLTSDEWKDVMADFNLQNLFLKVQIRSFRRSLNESMELDDVVTDGIGEKLSDWSGYFALCLCRLTGVKRRNAKPVPIPSFTTMLDTIDRIINRNNDIVAMVTDLQRKVTGTDEDRHHTKKKSKRSKEFFSGKFFDSLFGLD